MRLDACGSGNHHLPPESDKTFRFLLPDFNGKDRKVQLHILRARAAALEETQRQEENISANEKRVDDDGAKEMQIIIAMVKRTVFLRNPLPQRASD